MKQWDVDFKKDVDLESIHLCTADINISNLNIVGRLSTRQVNAKHNGGQDSCALTRQF